MRDQAGSIFWVASYIKSGNTWVRSLLASLLRDGGFTLGDLGHFCPVPASRNWLEMVTDMDTADMTDQELTALRSVACRQFAADGSGALYLKVHDRYDPALFPADCSAGVVYILRDPRDVAPSLADHAGVDLDSAIGRMGTAGYVSQRNGDHRYPQATQVMGSWSEHVQSWQGQRDIPLLLLRYEALLAEPLVQVRRLADFVGLTVGDTVLERAIAACSFDSLRRQEEENGFPERAAHATHFFRQGRAGGWRQTLSAAQVARLEADHGAIMTRLGYQLSGA